MHDGKQCFAFDLPINELLTKISKFQTHFFANALDEKIIMANELQAEYFGANSVSDFLGKWYREFTPKNESDLLTSNNIKIINSDAPQLFHEVCLGNECLSIKSKLFDSGNHVIGIAGVAFYFHQIALKDVISVTNDLVYLRPSANNIMHAIVANAHRFNMLSHRERECVYCLIIGMVHKEIASYLGVANRVVEECLVNIKHKLGCHSNSDVVGAVLS